MPAPETDDAAAPTASPTPRTGERAAHLGPARRRGPVLDASLEIFAEGGFAAASMSAIAARAGVSKAVLYDCFPGGKTELYEALLRRVEKVFSQHLADVFAGIAGQPLDVALTDGLRAFLDYADVNPLGFRIIFGSAGSADPNIVRRAEQIRDGIVQAMTDQAALVLQLKPAARPIAEVFARTVVAIAEDLARWSLRRPDLSRDAMVQMAVLLLMKGVEGVVPDLSRG